MQLLIYVEVLVVGVPNFQYDERRCKLKAKGTKIELIRRIGDKVHRQLLFDNSINKLKNKNTSNPAI